MPWKSLLEKKCIFAPRRGKVKLLLCYHTLAFNPEKQSVLASATMRSVRRAPFLLVLSSLQFALMAITAKAVTVRIPGTEIAFARFLLGLVFVLCAVLTGVRKLRFARYDLLLVRGFAGGIAVICYFSSISHLDVSIATLINFSSPIF